VVNQNYPTKEITHFTAKVKLTFFFLFISSLTLAQHNDSLLLLLKKDTLYFKTIVKADSIARAFQSKADSLNVIYQGHYQKVNSVSRRLQSMIDSLTYINLPVENLTNKMDSLHLVMNDQIHSLTKKAEDLKSNITQRLKEIQLPPPLQESLQKLQSSVDHYTLPSLSEVSTDLPKTIIPDFGNWQLPSLDKQLNLDASIGDIDGKIKELTGKAGGYGEDAQQLLKSDIGDFGNIENVMEGKLLEMEGAEQLREGSVLFKQAEQFDSAAMAEKANAMVKEMVVKVAKNHFEGKQEVLQKAMTQMTGLKNKYEEVQSMAALPKRMPNPLRGKPFIERFVPGITFQIQKSSYWLLDINPMLMYRIRPQLNFGAGWNHRLPVNGWLMMKLETVYGPRAALEVRWKKGVHFRLLPEIMNTSIPTLAAQAKGVDITHREWVASMFVGIKKDYTLYRQIKGNTEILYNLFDPDGLSPYGDRLAVRFGFDFPMKKASRN
jgi:hypothetical protein